MPSDVKLPGFGEVPKKPHIIGIVVAAGVGGYLLYKHRQGSDSAPATTPAANAYGYGGGYGYGLGIATYGYGTGATGYGFGYGSPPTGIGGTGGGTPVTGYGYGSGTGTGTPNPTTNVAWEEAAVANLVGAGYARTTVEAALNKYLNGGTCTSDQAQIVQGALAVEGFPPVAGKGGFPPAIHTSPQSGQSGGSKPGSGTGKIVGKRHVATGATTLNQWAKTNKTTSGEVVDTTEKNYQSGYMTTAHHTAFNKYLNNGTDKRMPSGLIFFSQK